MNCLGPGALRSSSSSTRAEDLMQGEHAAWTEVMTRTIPERAAPREDDRRLG
jgi:hypothetical protein